MSRRRCGSTAPGGKSTRRPRFRLVGRGWWRECSHVVGINHYGRNTRRKTPPDGVGYPCARPRVGDAKHLRTFREEYGRRCCRPGLVLHTGEAIKWLAPGLLAAPWWKVL
jgi:hypothetical protein